MIVRSLRLMAVIPRAGGVPSTPRPIDSNQVSLDWVTRTSAQLRTRRVTTAWGRTTGSVDRQSYAAGTGSAVTDLIFSIAKREVTFFSGTALISFL